MRPALLKLHRGLALALAAFWLLQAATGAVLAFRWELDDALLPGTAVKAEPRALGERIAAIERAGGSVTDLWASSMAATRFDIYYANVDGEERVMRVDGAGRELRDAPDGQVVANGGIFGTLTKLHASLLGGNAGGWVVAASGTLLLVTLMLGLRLAWPAQQQWLRTLLRRPSRNPAARARGWHRLAGLWGCVLLVPLVGAGILLCFEDAILSALDAKVPVPVMQPGQSIQPTGITAATAMTVALTHHAGATLSAVVMPGEHPWFRVRVRRPDDPRRNWGTTTVFVSAADGTILGDHPAVTAPLPRALAENIYPLHTGQLGGFAGRSIVLFAALALGTLVVLGLRLWWLRRTRQRAALVPTMHH